LDVIPAPAPPVSVDPLELENLRDVLRFLRIQYGWIILDLGRGVGRLASVLLEEIDSLFLVSTPEIPALYQTGSLAEQLQEAGYSRSRIHFIANRMTNSNKKSATPALQLAERMAGMPIYATVPNGYLEFCETYKQGKLLSPNTELSKALEALARRFVRPGEEEQLSPPQARFSQIWAMLART
jgi:pilus assembly protein CpaE